MIGGYVLRDTEPQAINSLRQFAVTSPVTLCLRVEEKSIEIKKVRAKSRLAKANRSSRMQK